MLELVIKPDSGDEYRLTATTRDIAKWERTNRGASFGKLQEDMHITDVYKIAYHAAVRHGRYSGSEKDFSESCDLDVLDDDESVSDPTPPEA